MGSFVKNEILLLGACLILFGYGLVTAQTTSPQTSFEPKFVVETARCEENRLQLSILNQYSDKDAMIFVISHTGKGEKKDIGQRRLDNTLTFLTRGFKEEYNRTIQSIVIAEASNSVAIGYLDFFVQDRLKLRIKFKRNYDLQVGTCVWNVPYERPCASDFEKLFYPCKRRQ
ncbi:MAG: hypothetical protein WBD27_05205 [Pyrinomonadaceae bacterium]